jgi:hypothetical protein
MVRNLIYLYWSGKCQQKIPEVTVAVNKKSENNKNSASPVVEIVLLKLINYLSFWTPTEFS